MMFIVKKNLDAQRRLFLNVIDEELKGKVLEDDNKKLDLTCSYYCGELVDQSKAVELINKAHSIQFIGNNSVDLGVKLNLVEAQLTVQKVKYAFVIR